MLAKQRVFRMSFAFWHCKTNVQVMPIAVFGFIQTSIVFRPNLNMEGKSSTQEAEIEVFANV